MPNLSPRSLASICAVLLAILTGESAAEVNSTSLRATSRFEVEGRLDEAGVIHYREIIRIDRGRQTLPPLTRKLWITPATFPLRQRVANVRVTDLVGTPLPVRTRSYGDFFNIDLLSIPPEIKTGIVIEYEVHRGVVVRGAHASLRWDLLGVPWPLPVTDFRMKFTLPAHFGKNAIAQTLSVDYAELEKAKMPIIRVVGDTLEWRYAHTIEPDRSMTWRLRFPPAGVVTPPGRVYVEDLLRDTGFVLLFLALILGLVPVLLFAPPSVVIGITRLWNICAVAIAVYAIGENSLYWMFEKSYRNGWGRVLITIAPQVGLMASMIAYAVIQERMLRRGDRAAYFTQLALPVALAIPLPICSTNAALLFLPLLGLPVAVFWSRRQIALHFGVGADPIVDAVIAEGEITMVELSRRVGVPEPQLRRVLAALPALPIVCDLSAGRCYAPTAALEDDSAGGGGLDLARPVPLLVESLARITEIAGLALILCGVTLTMFGVASGILDRTIGESLMVGAVIGGGVVGLGVWVTGRAKEFRRGEQYGLLRLVTGIMAPLLVPAVAFSMLGKNRIRLHFGVYSIEHLIRAIKVRGELSLSELATLLESTFEEAAATAQYLTQSDVLDANYDRAGARVTRRSDSSPAQ